ncbi:MAG: 5' nucleotidase, NT5C type [Bacillota bacterium]
MKRIGIDIDGVIADSQAVIINKINSFFGKKYSLGDFINFDPEKMLGIDRDALNRFIMERELEIILEAAPIPDAAKTIRELAERYNINLISARTPDYRPQTVSWLERYGVPHHSLHLLGRHDKRAECLDLGLNVFVEDNKKNAAQISSCGIPVLLMDATYNQGDLPPLVTRVFNWKQIRDYIIADYNY